MRSAAAIGLAVLAVAAGCGGESLSAAQRAQLADQVAAAKRAAGAHDAAGVRAALARFRADVRKLRDAGALSGDDADRLLSGALAASRRARAELAPTPVATATPTPTATPPPPPPAKPKGKGKEKGHGKKGDD